MVGLSLRGLESVSRQLRRYNEEMNGALEEGTKNAASALRNAVRAELRTPGTGREYPSRAARTNKALVADIITLGGDFEGRRLTKRELKIKKRKLLGTERRLARLVKRQGKNPENRHRASEVGRAPAPDVGLLPQAVKAGKRDGAYRVGVGGRWEGWEALHEGRGRQKGPRPFLLLGVRRIRDRLAGIWVRAVETRKRDA